MNSTDSFGRVTERTDYNEWGEITYHAPIQNTLGYRSISTDRTYTNHDYDVVLGLYYAKARMYDAGEKRFTQQDPVEDGVNWYLYCINNPNSYYDLTGLFASNTTIDPRAGSTKVNSQTARDIAIVQIRLISRNFLNKSFRGFGYYDGEKTSSGSGISAGAVNAYKNRYSIPNAKVTEGGIEKDRRAQINPAMWSKLGLPFGKTYYSFDYDFADDTTKNKGANLAIETLAEDLFATKFDLGDPNPTFNYWQYTFTYYYFDQFQCKIDASARLDAYNELRKVAQAGVGGYITGSGGVLVNLAGGIQGAIYGIMIYEFQKGIEKGMGSYDNPNEADPIDEIYKNIIKPHAEKDIDKAGEKAGFYARNNVTLVLKKDRISVRGTGYEFVRSMYLGDIFDCITAVRKKTGYSDGIKSAAVRYLESLAYCNVDPAFQKEEQHKAFV